MTTVRNRAALTDHGNREARVHLLDVATTAIDAVRPRRTVPAAVERDGDRLRIGDRAFDLAAVDDVYLVGAGKGAAAVAAELVAVLGDRLTDGTVAEKAGGETPVDGLTVVGAGHPIPDETSLRAGTRVLDVADAAGPDDLVIAAITGGASATLAAPAGDCSLADLAATTETLLRAGLRIDEINAVRKHCSTLKGGRLARRAAPAALATVVVVDEVAGDPWGPTVGDDTTFADALAVLDRHDLTDAVPPAVVDHLRRGEAGAHPETPPRAARDAPVAVLAGPTDAVEAARDRAAELGYDPLILSSTVEGESRDVATCLAAVAREASTHGRPVDPPCVLLSGGETTVRVGSDAGEGGPNQEFALQSAVALADDPSITTLALGTDGTDGPTDVAGGLVDQTTVSRLAAAGLDAEAHLRRHDSTAALRAVGDAVETGSTGTNVMDLRLTLVE
ncbi:glycerate kinase [Haloplanus litoreus]|uniref:Glycerate kinase n=1 Tax=Haloplanus litoreus TaxID=767515 RepID=A0ABD5ZVI3_9EURY